MKEKKVGLYLGVNSIGAAVTQGKDIISLAKFELSSMENAKAGALDEEIRWEALINKTLREVNVEPENVSVSLADRDFIFRSLEMPLMKRKEIESSLIYEVEKYIPFKIDELVWDYGYTRIRKQRKVNISFIGIRANNIYRIKETLSRLRINTSIIEPSCLSLVRVIKSLKSLSKFKNFALLDLIKSESYLTFFQNDLPIFNRYFTIPKKDGLLDLDKFIEAVSVSFQYFKNEFRAYKLEKFIIVSDSNDKNLVSSLQEELQVETEAVPVYDLSGRNNAEVESVKALGVVRRDSSPYKFKPVLKKAETVDELEAAVEIPALRIGLLSILVGVGLIASLFLSLFLGSELSIKLINLEKNIIMPKEFIEVSAAKRNKILKEKESKVKILKNIVSSSKRIAVLLDSLSKRGVLLPRGMWLEDLDIYRREEWYTGTLRGYIFRDDDYEERLSLNEFILNLKKDESVKSIFSNIGIDSSTRRTIRNFEVTYFIIKLK